MDLDFLIQKLKFLLEICLLTELALSDAETRSLLKRTTKYRYLNSFREWNYDQKPITFESLCQIVLKQLSDKSGNLSG